MALKPLPNRYRIEAVDRALVLLDKLSTLPGASASQLADAMGANRSLVFRLLSTLQDRGFVAKDKNNSYRLGPRLLYLGQRVEHGSTLVDASRDVMSGLLAETRENIYLLVRDGLEILCIAACISPQPVRLSADVGTKGGLHTGGASKVLLAYAPTEVVEAVIKQHLKNFVPSTLRTRKQVLGILEKIRNDGYYEAIRELNADIYSLSAPIRDGHGNVAAVLCIAGPVSRLDRKRQSLLLRHVREGAAKISVSLGSLDEHY